MELAERLSNIAHIGVFYDVLIFSGEKIIKVATCIYGCR